MSAKNKKVILIYGSFKEPTQGENFIVLRYPACRIPWSKKIVPAINRLVRPWFPEGGQSRDRFWNVDGGYESLWETTLTPRYEWDGDKLVKVNRTGD